MSGNITAQFAGFSFTTLIPVFTFILGLVGKIGYDWWMRKAQRRSKALEIHFTDLQEQYIKPAIRFLNCISNISSREGIIEYWDVDAQISMDAAKTSWPTNNSSDDFTCFRVHFPNMANELLKLESEVKLGNEANQALNAEITCLLEKNSGIQVHDYDKESNLKLPSFSLDVVAYIRFSYMEYLRIQSGDKRTPDQKFNFREVKYLSSQQDNNIFDVTLKDGRKLAKVNNVDEAERCKNALVEIAGDVGLIKNWQVLYKRTEELVDSSRSLSKSFGTICKIYGEFGTVLKKNEKCPICKLIQ